jgi:HTH-type transcriptional regulator / antitoxin HigA
MLDKTMLQAEQVWPSVEKILYVPHSDTEYERLVAILDQLIDEVGGDETHPLASLMEVIGALIEKYEDEQVPEVDEL